MAALTLDTSGFVELTMPHVMRSPITAEGGVAYWPDLSPFEQGYVEALFAAPLPTSERPLSFYRSFSDLSPEALAAILADCAEYEAGARAVGLWEPNGALGKHFWMIRQSGTFPAFPPRTASLGDDGKIYLRAAGQ